jgi:uroporphyrin-3 C-methyltransferase
VSNSEDKKDVELNEAFERLERQVVENNETTPAAASPSSPKSGSDVRKTPVSSGESGSVSGVLGVLLGLVALGVGSFGAYTAWQLQEQLQLEEQTTETIYASQIESLSGNMTRLQNQLKTSDQQLGVVQTDVAQLFSVTSATDSSVTAVESRVATAMTELKQQLGTSSEDWLLAEAEYLLRLANQSIVMEDDVAGSIALFESADKIVKEAEGIIAFDLRQAIANDIAALQSVSNADIQGIFVRLGAIAGQVESLEQKHLKFESAAPSAATEAPDQTFATQALTLLERGFLRITNMVDYRSGGEIVRPILPPQEEYFLKQNLLLKIQLAQLGLLKGNQAIFEQSLNDAITWLDQYFDADLPLTKNVRETLSTLSQTGIERELPDVSGSLREIRELMSRFHDIGERSKP